MKKVITFILSAMLFVNTLGITAFAAENSAKIIMTKDLNQVLSLNVTAENAVSYEYKWYNSASETGTFSLIYKQTGSRYTIANDDIKTYIRAEVTPIAANGTKGIPIISDTYYVNQIGKLSRTNYTTDRAVNKENPADNLVEIAGESILILDEYSDKNSAFYVMNSNFKGRHVFNTTTDTAKFDITNTKNIGYFLNHDFLTVGNSDAGTAHTITPKMQEYISNHLWWVEAGASTSNCPTDYSYTAKIGLLSRSEYTKYWGKFGWDPNGNTKTAGWWLRTSRGDGVNNTTEKYNALVAMGSNEGYPNESLNGWANTWNKNVNSTLYYLRPTFYLNENIFLNEKARVSTMGDGVKSILRERYTAEQLSKIYSADELKTIGFNVSSATISTDNAKNSALTTLTANFEVENATSYKYQWIYSDAENGVFKDIYKQTQGTYLISNEDKGRYISVKITPVFADGTFGKTETSYNKIFVENLAKVSRTNYRGNKCGTRC